MTKTNQNQDPRDLLFFGHFGLEKRERRRLVWSRYRSTSLARSLFESSLSVASKKGTCKAGLAPSVLAYARTGLVLTKCEDLLFSLWKKCSGKASLAEVPLDQATAFPFSKPAIADFEKGNVVAWPRSRAFRLRSMR